jgi:hypothetical protein
MDDAAFITDMLYTKDIAAYVAADWDAVADDFDPEAFAGYVSRASDAPLRLEFSELGQYRDSWVSGAVELLEGTTPEKLQAELLASSTIADIQFAGKWALVRKEFDGYAGAEQVRLKWVTYYHCRHDPDRWRIVGFTAFFPGGGEVAGQ